MSDVRYAVWDCSDPGCPVRSGVYATPEEAMAGTLWPDRCQWQPSGGGWILTDGVLDAMGAGVSPVLVDVYRPAIGESYGDRITLTVTFTGAATQDFSRAEYEEAKAAGVLGEFLDWWLSDADATMHVTEPDGTEVKLW